MSACCGCALCLGHVVSHRSGPTLGCHGTPQRPRLDISFALSFSSLRAGCPGPRAPGRPNPRAPLCRLQGLSSPTSPTLALALAASQGGRWREGAPVSVETRLRGDVSVSQDSADGPAADAVSGPGGVRPVGTEAPFLHTRWTASLREQQDVSHRRVSARPGSERLAL